MSCYVLVLCYILTYILRDLTFSTMFGYGWIILGLSRKFSAEWTKLAPLVKKMLARLLVLG